MNDYIPKWHKELEIFEKIKPMLILEGNVLDSYQYPVEGNVPKGSILRLSEYLHFHFKDSGYQTIAIYDSLRGFYNNTEGGHIDRLAQLAKVKTANGIIKADFKGNGTTAIAVAREALTQTLETTVIIMDFASRYIPSPDNMEQSEVDSFTGLLQASLEAKDVKTEGGMLKNLLILIVNKVNDIPAWFYLQNPNVRTITISSPTKEERELLIKGDRFPSFFAGDVYLEDNTYYQEHLEELAKLQDRFIALTDGFTFTELNGLRRLCKNERIHIRDMCSVIDLYKYGIKENPWKCLDFEQIKNAEKVFEKRVKGQEHAITKTVDVVKRAMTGVDVIQGSSHTRPKGVLFFAGPTGTGKTETAKTLAEILFGDESCCIRFDMSEYGQGHSDQKLLGAPPGYVGYESGGQLTNAIKKSPFSILLFDEIEKAHPTILDKFLQILDDGRMTDGQGDTVYFSECIIIFTSNLGIYTINERGEREANVSSDMPYELISQRVRLSIEDYFKLQLGRPEILNRIGENIVIFDYIRPDVAKRILQGQIEMLITNLSNEKRIDLTISEKAMAVLEQAALNNLANGGRGVRNIVESYFVTPLARYLFDNEIFDNKKILATDIVTSGTSVSLVCTIEGEK